MDNCIKKFIKKFKPLKNLQKPDDETLNFYRKILPNEIIELWVEYGFGEYGNGLIKIVNPKDYMNNLYMWLGKIDYTKIPIIVTAFGDIFYYRKLDNDENDVSMLNIHYREIIVCSYSYQSFFVKYITDGEVIKNVLRDNLYKKAIKKFGRLNNNDIFFFVPALVLGGKEDIKYIDKGNVFIQQQILFEIGNKH